jgi:hypothetical protein
MSRFIKKEASSGGTKFKNLLKAIDIYAKPIQMTYQGKEKFRTSCGGFLSLCVLLLLASIVSFNTTDLLNRSRTQIKKNTIVTQTNSYSPPENVSERNM